MLLLAATLLLAAPGLHLAEITIAPDHPRIIAEPDFAAVVSPICHQISYRRRSHYSRLMADLPGGLGAGTFHLAVRRFFCDVSDCPRKVFCEPLTGWAAAYARRTDRLPLNFKLWLLIWAPSLAPNWLIACAWGILPRTSYCE